MSSGTPWPPRSPPTAASPSTAPASPWAPTRPLVPAGLSLHLGLRALHRHGFTPAQALHCVTATPARLFGVEDHLGTVQPGRIADLTLVDGDPFTDFSRLLHTPLVLRDGIVHSRADLVRAGATSGLPGPADSSWLDIARHFRQGSCCHE
ncbi:amidohydrolase family protein [Streptomyces tricolor]|nr:amidohydrolase family protein [Streptomyces tricolor]